MLEIKRVRVLHGHTQQNADREKTNGTFGRLRDGYRLSVTWAVDHSGVMLALGACILALTFVLFAQVRRGFIPSEDTGQVIGTTQDYAEFNHLGPPARGRFLTASDNERYENYCVLAWGVRRSSRSVGSGGAGKRSRNEREVGYLPG